MDERREREKLRTSKCLARAYISHGPYIIKTLLRRKMRRNQCVCGKLKSYLLNSVLKQNKQKGSEGRRQKRSMEGFMLSFTNMLNN